jgi:hypothetical protein
MSIPSVPQPWRAADATFVEVELRNASDRQLRVEFACGLRLVITDVSQVPLAASLIETLRAGKEVAQ